MASDEECPDGEREREKALGLLLLAINRSVASTLFRQGAKQSKALAATLCAISLHSTAAAATSGSLADLRTVSFGPDGRPTTSSYLDDFPFPHYVLLRDAAGLPRALGGLVRRWVDAAAASSSSS